MVISVIDGGGYDYLVNKGLADPVLIGRNNNSKNLNKLAKK